MPATKVRPRPTRFSFPAPAKLIKAAAGDVQTFENSLASIGRSFLAPKAPGLFKHEIGFQVLDSDDDNSRAVGVFGFRIGRRLLYVPLFYRDGVFKGTEQLRDPKRKTAVPLSDNWVNKYLIEQGDVKPRTVDRSSRETAQPSLWQLKYPPTKYAAEFREIKRDLAGALARDIPMPDRAPAFDLLKMAVEHPAILEGLGDLATTYSWFGEALDKFHGREKIAAAVAEAEAIAKSAPIDLFGGTAPLYVLPPPPKAASDSTLTVIRVRQVALRRVGKPGGPKVESLYDPGEWEDLRNGDNNYKDNRGPEQKSKVTLWLGGDLPDGAAMSNPSENGVYEVLGPGHEFFKCVVLMPLVGWAPGIGRCLVVKLDGGEWCYSHPNSVWVRGQADQPELGKWVDGLKKVKAEVDGVPEGLHAAVARVTAGEHGGAFTATVPFDISPDGVAYPLENPSDAPFWAPFNPWNDRTDGFRGKAVQSLTGRGPTIHDSSREDRSPKRVEVFDEASAPRIYGNQLYLPVDCGLIELKRDKRFKPGNGSDPERVLFSRNYSGGDKKIELKKNAYSFDVFVNDSVEKLASYDCATELEADLVERHGLSVPEAKQAVFQVKKRGTSAFQVRYAPVYKEAAMPNMGLAHNFPNAPMLPFDQVSAPANFADDVVPSETSTSVRTPVTDMGMQPGTMDRYRMYPVDHGVIGGTGGIGNAGDASSMSPHAKDLEAILGATMSGRRDLFDTSSLAALVKHKRLDTLLRETRRNLGAAVTSLADDLAHLYWNTDEWAERFGDGEIGPLEDAMLSQFEKLGELVLTLQENASKEGPDMSVLPDMAPADNSEQGD